MDLMEDIYLLRTFNHAVERLNALPPEELAQSLDTWANLHGGQAPAVPSGAVIAALISLTYGKPVLGISLLMGCGEQTCGTCRVDRCPSGGKVAQTNDG